MYDNDTLAPHGLIFSSARGRARLISQYFYCLIYKSQFLWELANPNHYFEKQRSATAVKFPSIS